MNRRDLMKLFASVAGAAVLPIAAQSAPRQIYASVDLGSVGFHSLVLCEYIPGKDVWVVIEELTERINKRTGLVEFTTPDPQTPADCP